jgi:phenylalanyl-tRNA synthetase beta subunit
MLNNEGFHEYITYLLASAEIHTRADCVAENPNQANVENPAFHTYSTPTA